MQVSLNTRLELELRQRLDKYSDATGKPLAKVIAEALEAYLPKEDK